MWQTSGTRTASEGLWAGVNERRKIRRGTITIAEAIAMAARLHNICTGGSGEFTQGTPWYNVYVEYAIKNGIIRQDDFSDYSLKAKRGEMAYIFASAIPKNAIVQINNVDTLPDVDENTKYQDSIFRLYRLLLLQEMTPLNLNPNRSPRSGSRNHYTHCIARWEKKLWISKVAWNKGTEAGQPSLAYILIYL